MKAYDATLEDLFLRRVCYVIPAFQRPYVWKKEKQWQPLWDDILGMAERYPHPPHHPPAHFLGAIVTQQQQFRSIDVDPRRVIDGQQRLTTLCLLLGAMQEVFKNFDLPHAQEISKFVVNEMRNIDPNLVFKVWPTVLDDQNAFRRAMRNELPADEEKSNQITLAYEFFKFRVKEWIGDGSETRDRANILQEIVTNSLKIVMIEIDMNDNPHIIFERMNARGEALLQAELVKNFILDTAQKTGRNHNIAAKHLEKIEEKWWRKEVKQRGRGERPRVEFFLNHWMLIQTMEEVRPDKVFPTFCEYAVGKSITNIAEDIGRLAEVYRVIQETNDNSVLGRFLYRWHTIELGTPLTPVLMWLLSSDIPEENLGRCLRIIESYLVRRMICIGGSSKNYNRISLDLLHRLDENHRSDENTAMPDEVLKDYLITRQEDSSTSWPTDADLRESFLTRKIFSRGFTQKRLRIVLEGIEEGLRMNPKTDDRQVPKNLTIEHIMPQKWENHWDPPPPTDTLGEAEDRRKGIIHTIGNLTLLNQRLNGSLSDKAWLEKRKGMEEHTTLFLNRDLLDSASKAGDIWNEETIAARARRLAKVAAEVWPHADRI